MRLAGGSAGLLRDGKSTTWEGGIREPGIIHWPGKIKPGISTAVAATYDIFSTSLALAGVAEPSDRFIDGVDLSPVLFEGADIYSFCSATVSRQVMEADPMNIVHCPYHIFVMTQPDTPGVTTIGYRDFADASMDPVEELLDTIAREAIGRE